MTIYDPSARLVSETALATALAGVSSAVEAAQAAATQAVSAAENAQSAAASSAATLNTWFLRGTGSPVGVITPSSAGVQYVDLAATNGARVWISTGTTSSAWKVVDGDTGWRDVGNLVHPGGVVNEFRVIRLTDIVMYKFFNCGQGTLSGHWVDGLIGFSTKFNLDAQPVGEGRFNVYGDNSGQFSTAGVFTGSFTFATNVPWPTTLPGTPA